MDFNQGFCLTYLCMITVEYMIVYLADASQLVNDLMETLPKIGILSQRWFYLRINILVTSVNCFLRGGRFVGENLDLAFFPDFSYKKRSYDKLTRHKILIGHIFHT